MDGIKSIHFPDIGELRSRPIISRSRARSTGKYPSWKMGRMMHWESSNELNAFRLLDCDPSVDAFWEQPCKVTYLLDGTQRTHYPDIYVQTNHGKELWEVKPRSKSQDADFLVRTELMTRGLPMWGYSYRVAIGEELATNPRLSTACLLLRLGRASVSGLQYEAIRRICNQSGFLNWGDAATGVYGSMGLQTLCSLVLRGKLTVDLNAAISGPTQFLPHQDGI